jgi:hypothetical protein
MLNWLDRCMLAPNGLYWDHIDANGVVDFTQWSYNQARRPGVGAARHADESDLVREAHAAARPGSCRADLLGARYSLPLSAARRSNGTFTMPSRTIDRLIFERPAVRSAKRIGTSTTRKPLRSAR